MSHAFLEVDKGKAMNSIDSAYNYNDLSGLNAITKQGETDKSGALKEVARQYESMFVGMMLKSMREANAAFEEDNPLFSNESKFYRDMFDDQLVLSLSKGKGMGLADTLYRQLKEQFDNKESSENSEAPLNEKIYTLDHKERVNPFILEPNINNNVRSKIERHSSVTAITDTATDTEKSLKPIMPIQLEAQALEANKVIVNKTIIDQTPDEHERKGLVVKASDFHSPQEFVNTLWPIAQKVGDKMGVEPKAIIAQAALETGWGKYIIHQSNGENSHNLFGIKADNRWGGEIAKVSTLEYRNGLAKKEVAPFRVYDSYESSLKDYSQFVKDSERYKNAVSNGYSVKGYSEGLQKGGYATDPNYAKKIQRIASGDVLNDAIADIKRG